MGRPSEIDWRVFSTVSNSTKVDVLYAYLCVGYNMEEVAENVLHDCNDQASKRVSNITRCYGFDGRNAGRYRRYHLERKDIEGFVRKYPDGCYDCSIMDEYVRKIYESRSAASVQNTPVRQTTPVQQTTQSFSTANTSWRTVTQNTNTRQSEKYERTESSNSEGTTILGMIAILVVFVIAKFFLDWGWIVSGIVAFIGGAIIEALVLRGR